MSRNCHDVFARLDEPDFFPVTWSAAPWDPPQQDFSAAYAQMHEALFGALPLPPEVLRGLEDARRDRD